MFVKEGLKKIVNRMGYEIHKKQKINMSIPDAAFYHPRFSPWLGFGDFKQYIDIASSQTIVSADRCYVLYSLALQALNLEGHFYECGVYRGGTAMMFTKLLSDKDGKNTERALHLFDTFEGMPETDPKRDVVKKGLFNDTSFQAVQSTVLRCAARPGLVQFHQGFIPDTFKGLESHRIAFAHIDVDIYQSVLDCCHFIYPRLEQGAVMVFDDYGFASCPGARQAVDEYFQNEPEHPLVLPTGQAIIFRQE